MRSFFDLNITIPAGRKPGKYLQKTWPVPDISALVKSLEFCPVEFENRVDYELALETCHSCQSNGSAPRLFHKVYSSLPDIKFIGLADKKGTPVARCLINVKRGTFAPIYGEKHFLLRQRLLFAGYEEGEIAEAQEVEKRLIKKTSPACEAGKFPKSRKCDFETLYVYPEKPSYTTDIPKMILRDARKALEEFVLEVPDIAVFRRGFGKTPSQGIKRKTCARIERQRRRQEEKSVDKEIFSRPGSWEKIVENNIRSWGEYKSALRRYKRAFNKWEGSKRFFPLVKEWNGYFWQSKFGHEGRFGEPFEVNHERTVPIRESYEFVEKKEVQRFQSTLFLDSTREFLDEIHIKSPGWYVHSRS